jgi:hypothetical protein
LTLNDPGKIQGQKLDLLFDELIAKRTIISVYVVGTGFERLTCIMATEQDPAGKFLLIDQPNEFSEAAGQPQQWNLRFNFNGPDQLEYVFCTRTGQYAGRNLKVPFPEYVERLQRRKDFRIITLPGTKMIFNAKKLKGVIDLINISLGGAFGALRKHNQKEVSGSLFTLDQRLYKIGLIFPADNEVDAQVVVVTKAEVRRIEHDKERKLYKYAFEFTEIEKNERQKLTQAIYHIQRQFLKNR